MATETETEFLQNDANNSWNDVFQRLKNEASLTTLGDDFTVVCARDPENRRKNRYRDVSPYDHSRVPLSGDSDYINASYIKIAEANRNYILTQGPLDHTMGDLWQMTWEQDSKAIIMLNRVIEKGTLKCSQYWPLGEEHGHDDEMYFPESGLRVSLVSDQDFTHFTIRTLEIERMETGEKREILHFHYTTWPDFGVPSSPDAFLHFLYAVRQTGVLETDVGPAIVHCSAGIGRSGTFCLVDSCLVMVEEKLTLSCVNVKETLIKMRSYRMGLIQTADQLRFSYQAIIEGSNAILKGQSLSILQSPACRNTNHPIDLLPPEPPERVSSLQNTDNTVVINTNWMDRVNNPEDGEAPPPLPPKKGPNKELSELETWGQEEEEEFDQLIDRDEDGESSEEEDEAVLAAQRKSIRDQRKLETLAKIEKMKEKQRNSTHFDKNRSYFGNTFYFGLAVLVGVAGVVIYRYLW